MGGTWQAVGVNHVLLFARYGDGGHFSPHTDCYTVVDFNRRSLYSLLIYFNDCLEGGATRLMAYDEDRSQQFVRDEAQRFRWPEARVLGAAPVHQGSALRISRMRVSLLDTAVSSTLFAQTLCLSVRQWFAWSLQISRHTVFSGRPSASNARAILCGRLSCTERYVCLFF